MGQEKIPLWVYVSPSISQTYNKLRAPFENKMREIYFYKKCVSFVCWSSFIIFDYILGWVYEKYTTNQLIAFSVFFLCESCLYFIIKFNFLILNLKKMHQNTIKNNVERMLSLIKYLLCLSNIVRCVLVNEHWWVCPLLYLWWLPVHTSRMTFLMIAWKQHYSLQ